MLCGRGKTSLVDLFSSNPIFLFLVLWFGLHTLQYNLESNQFMNFRKQNLRPAFDKHSKNPLSNLLLSINKETVKLKNQQGSKLFFMDK